ncbi:MAG: glycosyltransferase [Candidatus Thermoplasmatota archaeon]|nr:glycosyltransferase [Candidatus Thermoplasmatota archaeon]
MTKRGNRHPLIADMLVKKGYDVTYITTNFYHADKTFFSKEDIKRAVSSVPYKLKVQKNVGYKKILSPKRILSHIEFAIKTGLFLLKNKADLVIIPSRPMELIFVTSWISLIKRFKIILDVRDIWPDAFPQNNFISILFNFYCSVFLFLSMWNIKHFLYVSPSFIDWIKRYSKPINSIFVPLGYDNDRWNDIKEPNIIPGKWKLLFIGNFSLNFNFYPLIDAIGENKIVRFTMVGGGDNINMVKEYIKKNEYNNIELTGFVDKSKVVDYMNSSDITVIPMIGQSIPNKFFDSIGGMRPIIVFGDYDTASFVKKENIGWVVNFHKDEISRLLRNMNVNDYKEKYNNIRNIRSSYSKNILYEDVLSLMNLLI